MKKLGKLSINPEKVINNEELVKLRGGYSGTCAAIYNGEVWCGVSRTEAIFWAGCTDQENGTNCSGNWCCDSCASTSWYTQNC